MQEVPFQLIVEMVSYGELIVRNSALIVEVDELCMLWSTNAMGYEVEPKDSFLEILSALLVH